MIIREADVGATDYTAPFSLPPEWYSDPEIYRRETESIFYGSWRLAAHKSELAKRGDYVTVDFCDESLLLVRDRDHALRGFYNVCQHRGHRLIESRRGNLDATMVCPYHAWSYKPRRATAWCAERRQGDGIRPRPDPIVAGKGSRSVAGSCGPIRTSRPCRWMSLPRVSTKR